MKKLILFSVCLLLLLAACSMQYEEPTIESATDAPTSEQATIAPELLPSVYADAAAFEAAGNIAMAVPEGATEVTRIILYDEIRQVQFVYDDVFYTYRAAFSATGRTGSELTELSESLNYLDETVVYGNENVDFSFEAHLLVCGGLLLWSDGEVNYSLSTSEGTFENLCAVADLIVK